MGICKFINFNKKSIFVLGLLLIFSFDYSYAENSDNTYNIKGFIIKNPQIVYKDENSKMISGYFEIENLNEFNDKLLSISGEISENIQIHNTKVKDGVMKMYKIDQGVNIKKNTELKFQPGGYHLMIMKLKKKILNKNYILSLNFKKSGKINVKFKAISLDQKLKMTHSH